MLIERMSKYVTCGLVELIDNPCGKFLDAYTYARIKLDVDTQL